MNRRAFFSTLAAGLAAAADPERLLWVPGRKLISIPSLQKPEWCFTFELQPVFDLGSPATQKGRAKVTSVRDVVVGDVISLNVAGEPGSFNLVGPKADRYIVKAVHRHPRRTFDRQFA